MDINNNIDLFYNIIKNENIIIIIILADKI